MTMTLYLLFLVACYLLAYFAIDLATDAVIVAREGNNSRRRLNYGKTMFVVPLSFAYIMGYLFIPF